MGHVDTDISTIESEINPYVSRLADRLMQTAADAQMRFDSDGWQLITEMLSFAASAEQRLAEQTQRIEQLEVMSITDELTGLANRRGLERFLANALSAAARHGDDGVVGYIDLDGFKAINDTMGHAAGDLVLRRLARELKTHTRPTDMVSRIAGDEFAVVLTRCDAREGMIRLQELQRALNGTEVRVGDETISLRISLGMAPYNGSSKISALLDQADKAMYSNKKARKGRLN